MLGPASVNLALASVDHLYDLGMDRANVRRERLAQTAPRALSREEQRLLLRAAERAEPTCLTTLVRQGEDLVMVAEIAGHVKIETTRRYALPSTADRQAAMERMEIDF